MSGCVRNYEGAPDTQRNWRNRNFMKTECLRSSATCCELLLLPVASPAAPSCVKSAVSRSDASSRSCEHEKDEAYCWRAAGECASNTGFHACIMRRGMCGLCSQRASTSPAGACVDDNDCSLWAKTGECQSNKAYMDEHCARSCSACSEEGQSARNHSPQCQTWAGRQCSTNEATCRKNASYNIVQGCAQLLRVPR